MRQTPLYDAHRSLGAKLVEFGGWSMPLVYTNAADEHRAVRQACGVFDVSHMGEVEVRGAGARAFCQRLTVNDVDRLGPGQGQYTVFCNDGGGVVDDLIVYCFSPDRYLLVINAGTTPTDLQWIRQHATGAVEIEDVSDDTALIALQGPEAESVLAGLTPADVSRMRPFTIVQGALAGHPVAISRTGYTGEDGFEIFTSPAAARPVWDAVLAGARARGGEPAGLGARDTLRLEAGLPLYGSDLDSTTTPIEAGLGWVVKLSKGSFIGREVLAEQVAHGPRRRLVAFVLREPGVPRHGCTVFAGDGEVGVVTSGAKTPTVGEFIGLAYVRSDLTTPGTELAIAVRGRRLAAHVVARPFYRRPPRRCDG